MRWKVWGKRNHPTLLRGCKLVLPLWRIVWSFLNNLKIEFPYNPAVSLLGIYPEETKTLIKKDPCPSMFIAAIFTTAKTWKHPKCPLANRKRKSGRCSGILLSHAKGWNDTIYSNMDGARDYYTKWNQSDRNRNVLYHLYMESKKNDRQTNLNNRIDSKTQKINL